MIGISYLSIGLVVFLIAGFSDTTKRRFIVPRILAEIAFRFPLGGLVWLVLWPVWVVLLLCSSDNRPVVSTDVNSAPKTGVDHKE
jgi:hypothetical protein